MGHRGANPDRGKHHHVARVCEHYLRKTFAKPNHRATDLANRRKRHGEEYRESNDLKHITSNHRIDHARWKDMNDGFYQGLWLCLRDGFNNVRCRGDELNIVSWLYNIDDGKANKEREGSHDLEIDKRLDAHTADFFYMPPTRDSN